MLDEKANIVRVSALNMVNAEAEANERADEKVLAKIKDSMENKRSGEREGGILGEGQGRVRDEGRGQEYKEGERGEGEGRVRGSGGYEGLE